VLTKLTAAALALTLAGTGLSGCAWTRITPVAPNDTVTPGLRIYDSKPLLFVTTGGGQINFIPNPDKAYAVRYGAFLAKNNIDIQLDHGIVKGLKNDLDSTKLIELLQALAEKALPALTGSATAGTPVAGIPVAVYEFQFDGYGNLVGLRLVPFLGGVPPLMPIPGGGSQKSDKAPDKAGKPPTPEDG
jgi:hypothetical protein